MPSTKQLIIVSTWFQACWFIGVVGQGSLAWLLVVLGLVTVLVTYKRLAIAVSLIGVVAFSGIVIDSLNHKFGLLLFDTPLIPVWLAALWLMFAWYAIYLCRVINHYPLLLVALVGGGGGALSYIAGFKLGAVEFGVSFYLTAVILYIEWFFIVLAILTLYRIVQQRKGSDNHGQI